MKTKLFTQQPRRVFGRDPFVQKFRNFRFRGKWNGNFRKVHLENFGQPLEVVHFPEISELPEIFCSIWHFISVRRSAPPVSFAVRCRRQDGGICVCQWDETGLLKWKKPFHLTPEYFGNSNRNFCPNGSRPEFFDSLFLGETRIVKAGSENK